MLKPPDVRVRVTLVLLAMVVFIAELVRLIAGQATRTEQIALICITAGWAIWKLIRVLKSAAPAKLSDPGA